MTRSRFSSSPKPPPLSAGEMYALEKFGQAVRTLQVHPGDARQRVAAAYRSFFPVRATDLPSNCRKDYEYLMQRLLKYPPNYPSQGRVNASCQRMKRATGSRLAQIIVDIYERLLAIDKMSAAS